MGRVCLTVTGARNSGNKKEKIMYTTFFIENDNKQVLQSICFFGNDPSLTFHDPNGACVAHAFDSVEAAQLFIDSNSYLKACHVVSGNDARYFYTTTQCGRKSLTDFT